MLNLLQVIFAAEAFRVDLVDVLGSRRPRREPSALRHHLDSAERLAVPGRPRQLCRDRLAGEVLCGELFGSNFGKPGLLFG